MLIAESQKTYEDKIKMKLLIALFAIIILPLFCGGQTKKITLTESVQVTKQEILNRIPLGSDIEEAKEIMKQNDFKCKMKQNAAFVEYDDEESEILHEGEDFLWCEKSKVIGVLTRRRWQVIITHKNGVVSNIFVSSGLIAP